MSGSTYSLKKKVCVTVFLDELFEEVNDKGNEDCQEVSQVPNVQVQLANGPKREEFSHVKLSNDSDMLVSFKANARIPPSTNLRPRKHRKEFKFSNNMLNVFQNELEKFGYDSDVKQQGVALESVESTISDSDILSKSSRKADTVLLPKSRSSCMLSVTDDSSASINGSTSSTMASSFCDKKAIKTRENYGSSEQSSVHFSRSFQFDRMKKIKNNEFSTQDEGKETGFDDDDEEEEDEDDDGDDVSGHNNDDEYRDSNKKEDLVWEKTQKQIQLILEKVKNQWKKNDIPQGNRSEDWKINSTFNICDISKKETFLSNGTGDISTEHVDCVQDIISWTSQISENQTSGTQNLKWKNRTEEKSVRHLFDSDKPDNVYNFVYKDDILRLHRADTMFCYNLCVKCRKAFFMKRGRGMLVKKFHYAPNLLPTLTQSCVLKRWKSEKDQSSVMTSNSEIKDKTSLCMIFKRSEKKESYTDDITQPETETETENFRKGKKTDMMKFAEGDRRKPDSICDVFQKSNKSNSTDSVDTETELKYGRREGDKKKPSLLYIVSPANYSEKKLVDSKCEIILAKSENFNGRRPFKDGGSLAEASASYTIVGKSVVSKSFIDHPASSGQVKNATLKKLKRIKTIEVLEGKNISAEVVLVCENLGSKMISLEAWDDDDSGKMKQCYIKDLQSSSMYLIEVPFHFTSNRS